MRTSYWEQKEWLDNDFVVVGSGIVGLTCALHLTKRFPNASVLVLEKGVLPQGASTKNAGFACFGSVSELLSDLQHHSEQEVLELVQKRWEGLLLLRQTLGDKALDYKPHQGYELFRSPLEFERCASHIGKLNRLLYPLFQKEVYTLTDNCFGFQNIVPQYICNRLEGQLDTGKMMTALLQKVISSGIKILNATSLMSWQETSTGVVLETSLGSVKTQHLFIATNGFARELLQLDVQPARAQVLVTKPIPNLSVKGTFHLEEGYYYFRNIDNRILLGGGRNLDFEAEQTTEFGLTKKVQASLEALLSGVILPAQKFEIDQRWSGIMGVGPQKKSIMQSVSDRVHCGVRLGGMGVAIGTLVGKELSEQLG